MSRPKSESQRKRALVALARRDPAKFDEALKAEDDSFLFELTDVLENERCFAVAERCYRALVARDPSDVDRLVCLAINIYYRQRDGLRAEELLREATATFPASATLANIRGTNLGWGLGRHWDALGHYERAVALQPEDGTNQACLAWCLLWLGEIARGCKHARLALAGNVEEDNEVKLASHLYLFLFTHGEDRLAELGAIAALLADGAKVDGWDASGLVSRAVAAGHPDARFLESLSQVVGGHHSMDDLEPWPTWRQVRGLRDREAPSAG